MESSRPATLRRALPLIAVVLVLVMAGILVSVGPVGEFLSSGERLRQTVRALGPWGPIAVTVYHIVQVVVAPVPGQVVDFADGYLFGSFWGSVYSVTGVAIGTLLAAYLARRYGRPLVVRFIGKRSMATVDRYLGESRLWVFFVLFLLPATPDDLLCFALGLSPIPLSRGVPVAVVARIPGVVASVFVGATGSKLSPLPFMLLTAAVTVLGLLVLPRFMPRRVPSA